MNKKARSLGISLYLVLRTLLGKIGIGQKVNKNSVGKDWEGTRKVSKLSHMSSQTLLGKTGTFIDKKEQKLFDGDDWKGSKGLKLCSLYLA